ncbi:MAG TPA: hypothetical protein VK886_14560 [Vicinamibacterales bacterium]|nr:hypothetical protein [Vicinamibacterales bacterium]
MPARSPLHPRLTALPLLAVLTAACGSGSKSPVSPLGPGAAARQHVTANFIFHYTPADAAMVAPIANGAEAEHDRIVSELQPGSMPAVNVQYYAGFDAMRDAVRPIAGDIPAWATGLVTAADRIHLISPAALGVSVDRATVSVVHEFAHCVTLRVEPRSANNPRWLWESIALYEARQFVHPSRIPALAAGVPPTLAQLNSFDQTVVYDLGYLIGEFIVARWGTGALARLARGHGDTVAVLGLSQPDFEREWFVFVRSRYGV